MVTPEPADAPGAAASPVPAPVLGLCEITGLADRRALLARADAACHRAQANGTALLLLALQVPQAEHLAGTLGSGAADSLVCALAARLLAEAPPGTELGHLGDGEFAALLPQPGGPDRAGGLQVAGRWQSALQAPVDLGGLTVYPHCHIGLAVGPEDAADGHTLLLAAQTARREAPPAGGPACFRAESRARTLRQLQLESGLRRALERGEFTLAYQPQLCLSSGRIVGAEALLRWQSGELGEVSAEEFIPVAERAGLMPSIGDWVIHQACAQIARWRAAALPPVRVGVNVSPLQFQLGNVAATVREALAASGTDPTALALELTEAALQHGGERVRTLLKGLRADGVGVTLDDFGTGASSLNSLRSLPLDLLKIDRGFVADLTAAPEAAAVTRSMLQLAHALGLTVLAEGVETEGQLRSLLAEGCDRIQGYLFSPPVSAEQLAEMLKADRRLALPAAPASERHRSLLLVDDETHILSALKRLFRRDGYRIHTAESGEAALELLAREPVDVIVSDQRMPGMAGVDFLRRAKVLHPHTVRMTLSGFTDLQSIIDAVNEGAVYKFLTKPWDDERLRGHVAEAFAQKELADENRRLQAAVAASHAEQATLNRRLNQMLERQKAQAQLVQAGAGTLRRLVEALPVAMIGVDPDGLLAFANPAAGRWLAVLDSAPGLPAGQPLQQLLERLRGAAPTAGPAQPTGGIGLTLRLGGQPVQAWLAELGGAGAERGSLLVLASLAATAATLADLPIEPLLLT